MNPKVMKIVGSVLPIVGVGVSLVTNWFEDKKIDDKITSKVAEAISKAKES